MNSTFIFVAASFCSSFSLFLVEPLIGKRLLPNLGGSPSVWVVATVVFQVLLLLGYVYAHALAKLKLRWAALIHLGCMALALATYPFSLGTSQAPEHPTLTTALLIARSVGFPFFALSANAPLLQSWFRGGNKYRLYAASNAGSFSALFVFPFLLEPFVGLRRINTVFAATLFASLVLLAWCVVISKSKDLQSEMGTPVESKTDPLPAEEAGVAMKLEWVLLSAAASLLLSSVNAFVVVDLGALPLLWVVPLAIYLLSFVIGFEEKVSVALLDRFLPFVSLAVVALLVHRSPQSVTWTIVAMLLLLFFGSVLCHRRLYLIRPHESRLTEFYFFVAVGGALGGLFAGTLAPVLFRHPVEFWTSIFVVLFAYRPREKFGAVTLIVPAIVAVICGTSAKVGEDVTRYVVAFTGLALYSQRRSRPMLFSVSLAAILLSTGLVGVKNERLERNYFGTFRVKRGASSITLIHGSTVHGRAENPPSLEPHSYYSRSGPVGIAIEHLRKTHPVCNVGAIGLGAGSLLSYWEKKDRLHVFEIDPDMVRIAGEEFPFLRHAQATAAEFKISIGDARQTLRSAPASSFDILFVDAFSSDAVPVHLLTLEAMSEFRSKVKADGVLLFHISNRYFDLEPVVAGAADAAGLRAVVLVQASGAHRLDSPSKWVWVSTQPGPASARAPRGLMVWTDDFSSAARALAFTKNDVFL